MRQVFGQIDSDEIFDELCLLISDQENISKLNDGETKLSERWQEVFEYLGSNKREISNLGELPSTTFLCSVHLRLPNGFFQLQLTFDVMKKVN
jgi:hypothetical protein